MSKFIGLKNDARKFIKKLEPLDDHRKYGRRKLRKWKINDGKKQVGEINETIQIVENNLVFTNLEFTFDDGKSLYVFDWKEDERKSIKK